ncbi:hypothetical protein LCGC14_2560430, partial [marine sediment metagenome]
MDKETKWALIIISIGLLLLTLSLHSI